MKDPLLPIVHPDILPSAVSPTVRLEYPSADQKKRMAEIFDASYTKERLLALLKDAAATFLKFSVKYPRNIREGLLGEEADKILTSKVYTLQKGDLVDLAASWFCCQANFDTFYSLLSQDYRKLWQAAASLSVVTSEKCEEILGRPVVSVSKSRGYWHTIDVDAQKVPWLVWDRTFYTSSIDFSLPIEIRPFIFSAVYPAVPVEQLVISELPDASSLVTFDSMVDTLKAIPVLLTFLRQGILELGSTKINLSTAKKVQKALGFAELFPDSSDKNIALWRSELLAGTMCQVWKPSDKDSSLEILKKLFSFAPDRDSSLRIFLKHLLPQYEWRSGSEINHDTLRALAASAQSVLSRIPQGKWIGMNDFLREFMRQKGMWVLLNIFSFTSGDVIIRNARNGVNVSRSNFKQQFGVPLLQAYLTYLAVIGAVEIARDEAAPSDPSPVSRMRYIRVTPLGEYLMGLSKDFRMPVNIRSEKEEFELSDTHLLLRPLHPDNPYLGIVKEFASPVGAGRYAVTPQSFLINCRTENDIKARISLFRELVCDNPPQNWEDFFKLMISNSSAFESSAEQFILMKISGSHPELMRLIATSPELRGVVIRAEDGYLLVNSLKYAQFEVFLRRHGYLPL